MHQEDTNPQQDNNQMAQRQMPSMTHSKTQSIGQKAILLIGGIVVLMALIGVNGGFGYFHCGVPFVSPRCPVSL